MRGNECLLWLSPLPDPNFVAAFSQLDLEPLAETVMRRGQEVNSHGVSPLFFGSSAIFVGKIFMPMP
jgi:hypothetical protein